MESALSETYISLKHTKKWLELVPQPPYSFWLHHWWYQTQKTSNLKLKPSRAKRLTLKFADWAASNLEQKLFQCQKGLKAIRAVCEEPGCKEC